MGKIQTPVSQELQESRDELKRSIHALREDLSSEFGHAPGRSWLLPLCAAGVGLVAAWALKRRLARPVADDSIRDR